MMNAKQRLGNRVRMLREEKHLSQRRFALMIGMDKTYLSGIENGNRNATISTLEKISEGLGIEVEDLFVKNKTA